LFLSHSPAMLALSGRVAGSVGRRALKVMVDESFRCCSSSSSSSGGNKGYKQAAIAHAYLRQYIEKKKAGDVVAALSLLEKASGAAKHVHVTIPVPGPGIASSSWNVPLSAIVSPYSCDEDAMPRCLLPVTVDPGLTKELGNRELNEGEWPDLNNGVQFASTVMVVAM